MLNKGHEALRFLGHEERHALTNSIITADCKRRQIPNMGGNPASV